MDSVTFKKRTDNMVSTQNTSVTDLRLKRADHLHLDPGLGSAAVIQLVLSVQVPGKKTE